MKNRTTLSLLFLFLAGSLHAAELPNAPGQQDQESIMSSSAQNIVKDGQHFKLARWSVSAYAVHDPVKGWEPSSRIDYRISSRWGIAFTEVRTTFSGGFTWRFGAVK